MCTEVSVQSLKFIHCTALWDDTVFIHIHRHNTHTKFSIGRHTGVGNMYQTVADLENEKGRIQTQVLFGVTLTSFIARENPAIPSCLAITRLAWLHSARYNYYTRLCHGCGNVRLTLVRASKNALRRPDLVN